MKMNKRENNELLQFVSYVSMTMNNRKEWRRDGWWWICIRYCLHVLRFCNGRVRASSIHFIFANEAHTFATNLLSAIVQRNL